MTLLDRIRFQKSIHPKVNEVWLPADEVEALIEKVGQDSLKAQAYDREERRKKRRREAEPQPRRKSIAAQMMEADSAKERL